MALNRKKRYCISNDIDRSDVERAMRHSKSNKGAARYLGVSIKTYKKIASRYRTDEGKTLWEIHCNKAAVGIPKFANRNSRGPVLMDILEGTVSTRFISMKEVKRRLLVEGYMREECARCKFSERRKLDETCPLIMNYVDGNKKNWRLENLELLCYNCYYINIGNIFEQKQINAMEDYKVLQSKPIDLDLPKIQEDLIKESINLENKFITREEEIPDDYGEDLISYYNRRK